MFLKGAQFVIYLLKDLTENFNTRKKSEIAGQKVSFYN